MIKINIGCGRRNFGKDWIHIDGDDYPHLDYKDIFNLKFKDNTVDLIYASHVIEYFDRLEIKKLLSEWNRVLKPHGKIRIAVPNFKVLSKLYLDNKISLSQVLGPLYGRMDMDGKQIYHRTTYDFDDITAVLKSTGFNKIDYYDWQSTCHAKFDDHSQAYIPHMDKKNGILISLNVEGVKVEL